MCVCVCVLHIKQRNQYKLKNGEQRKTNFNYLTLISQVFWVIKFIRDKPEYLKI